MKLPCYSHWPPSRSPQLLEGQSVYTALEGRGNTPEHYYIRVENSPTTVCPEACIDMRIEAGNEFTWRIAYDFYTLPESGAN